MGGEDGLETVVEEVGDEAVSGNGKFQGKDCVFLGDIERDI